MKALHEQLLLRRIRTRGDESAFAELYELYARDLVHFVEYRVPARDDADEIVAEVFISLWKQVTEKSIRHVRGLLYKMARNKIVDYYRKNGKKSDVELDDSHLNVADLRDIDVEVGVDLEIEVVVGALGRLRGEYRDLIVMRYVDQLEVKEIAEALQKTRNAVRIGIHRALSALRTDLIKRDENKKD